MKNKALEVINLTKKFGNFTAVDNISFSVEQGEVLGLLGPNGAGKTTTIHMLLGITLLDFGEIKYFGKDLFKKRQYCLSKINFASAYNTLQGRISAWENLLVFAHLYNVKNPKKKILELSDYFEVTQLLPKRYWDLSAGERTRVNLIKSLLNDPELILMDEPTASLDPDIADKTLSLIENLKKNKNISILFTSHNMDEVTRICDRVLFLDRGRIVALDTPLGLTKKIENSELVLMFEGSKKVIQETIKDAKLEFRGENRVVITTTEKSIPSVIFDLSKAGIWITDIEVKKPTLEDFFLKIVRKD